MLSDITLITSEIHLTQFKAPWSRTRLEGGFTRPQFPSGSFTTACGSVSGTYVDTTLGNRQGGYEGTHRVCHDVVTPGFQVIKRDGGILNNPFTSVTCIASQGGVGQIAELAPGYHYPWVAGRATGITVASTLRHSNASFLLGSVIGLDGTVVPLSTSVDLASLLSVAKTKALSNVDQSVASGIVSIAELKRTLVGLATPLSNIRRFIDWWKKRRRKKTIDFLGEGSDALANDYLALYYGLLPFCKDIESLLDAYIASGTQPERLTARGTATKVHEAETEYIGNRASSTHYYDIRVTHLESVVVRSGILYVPSADTWQKAYGMRFSDLLPAVYESTPWSFFIDYFSNLGTLIGALTPRVGVKYLASWSSTTIETTDRAECFGGGVGSGLPGWSWTRQNTEFAERVTRARVRQPESPYEHIGFVPSSGLWESKTKILAVIALIVQQDLFIKKNR